MYHLCASTAVFSMIVSLLLIYFIEQLAVDTLTTGAAALVALVTSVMGAGLSPLLNRVMPIKSTLMLSMGLCTLFTALGPVLFYRPDQVYAPHVIMGVYGLLFVAYFNSNLSMFAGLVLGGEEAEYCGLAEFFAYILRFFPPLMWVAIVQGVEVDAHRWAWGHFSVYFLVAAGILCTVDPKKGEQAVAESARQRRLGIQVMESVVVQDP